MSSKYGQGKGKKFQGSKAAKTVTSSIVEYRLKKINWVLIINNSHAQLLTIKSKGFPPAGGSPSDADWLEAQDPQPKIVRDSGREVQVRRQG